MGLIYRESVRDSDAGHRHADRGRACERFQMRGMMPNRTALQCKTTLRPSYFEKEKESSWHRKI